MLKLLGTDRLFLSFSFFIFTQKTIFFFVNKNKTNSKEMSTSNFLDTLRKHELSQVIYKPFSTDEKKKKKVYLLSLTSFILRK